MSDIPGLREFGFWLRLSKARFFLFLSALLVLSMVSFSEESGNSWTENTLNSLPLREKIAQLIQVRVPGKFINRSSADYAAIVDEIKSNKVGGVILFAGNIYESALLLNELQGISRTPLLVSADFERGLSFRIADATSFPWTMAIGAANSEELAFKQGLVTGSESRALGVHWIFAPVMDVNNNPENPVINIRSFGQDPALVARLGSAFIRGARKARVLTTAKHFPGHGDTSTDSHLGLALVQSDPDRLRDVELLPFRSAIEAGVDSIMTAHVAVPKLTGSENVPATLSSKILTDLLRNTLKFNGLIVTDALEMGAITESYWGGLAAIRALQAGADVLLLPTDTRVAISEIERAVKRGDITEARINASVRKILDAKHRLGLHRQKIVPVRPISDIVASPQNMRLAQEIADRSITLVKDSRRLLPVNPLKSPRIYSLVLASDFESSPGAAFQSELRRHFTSVRTAWGNARMPEDLLAGIESGAADSDIIICSTLVRLSSGQDRIGMPRVQQMLMKKLIASGKPLIWISFGNPYLLRAAPEAGTYLCAFSYSDVSQIAAAKAIAGEIPISGKMPVSIPGYAETGEGLQVPKLPMTLKWAPDSGRYAAARQQIETLIRKNVFRGVELIIGRNSEVAADFHAGQTGPAQRPTQVSSDTTFTPGSLFRMVGTLSAAMLAVDSGVLLPRAQVSEYLLEQRAAQNGTTRIQELLTGPFDGTSPDPEARATLLETIISRATGIRTDAYLAKHLFGPLGMSVSTSPSGGRKFRGRDIAVFAQMLLNRGMYDHHRYFKPDTVTRYTGPKGAWAGPADYEWMKPVLSNSAFGHFSSSGGALWIDPEKDMFIVLLADPSGNSTADQIAAAQRALIEAIVPEI